MALGAEYGGAVAHLAKDLADLGRSHEIAFGSDDGVSGALARSIS